MNRKGKLGRLGFDGRTFLTEEEWKTYLRNMPVRYPKKKKEPKCAICGRGATTDNPFENSHLIGFNIGIIQLGLTPDFLNSDDNIVTAHKRICNKRAEKSMEDCMQTLLDKGVKSLPDFLPKEMHAVWGSLKSERRVA